MNTAYRENGNPFMDLTFLTNPRWGKGLLSPKFEKQEAQHVTLLWIRDFCWQNYHWLLSFGEENVKHLKK